ncbi:DUF6178 family protein [Trichloromonas sp.]|uniref:DUF6178 family protein n=1 Tax=Trichloromonas sp. TaxID=3069249 RepID=UPI002A45906D|nr:DUF6178 family protein [Trichloromonas sp.]
MNKIELPAEKRVGHLKLLREPRRISPKEFNALSRRERLDIIRREHGRKKYNLLIEADDAEALVQRMAAQEVYLLIKELGHEDSVDLIPMVDADQLTTFLDLDCWRGDVFDGAVALQWLALLLEAGDDQVVRAFRQLDFELLVLMIKKQVNVLRGPEDIDDEDVRIEAVHRDGGYEIEYRDGENAKLVGAILDILFRADSDFYQHLLESVRWEQDSLLEEEVYALRRGRLLDCGFPDPFEALAVLVPLDPARFDPAIYRKSALAPGENVEPPGFYLTPARPRDLLAEVLTGGIREEVAWELTYLVNKVLTAERVDVGDLIQVQAVTEEVYRYLNLALEELADGEVGRGISIFDEIYLEILYRVGFSLTLRLGQRAKSVRQSPVGPYLDGPFRALVEALLRKKPRFFEGILQTDRGGERPFATRGELLLAEEWLDRLETRMRLFDGRLGFELPASENLDLAGCHPDHVDDLALSDFFLTALANRLLGRPFVPAPIPRSDLAELHGRVCRAGKLDVSLREETLHFLEGLEVGAGEFGVYCLDLWEEEFCRLKVADLDPRYGCGLIVKD